MVVIRRPRDGAILVSGDTDDDGSGYERPLGGHVELGELAAETVCRELQEETGQELRNVHLLEVIENMFTLNGGQGHEIVFVFEADFVDGSAYDIEEQLILDDPTGRVRVRWRAPDEDHPRLVPSGIERFTLRQERTG
jgi:ADP-ribose pyrophosphatase YjhB (NUDIX family)